MILKEWMVEVGVPSRLLVNFSARNNALLHASPGSVPPLTGSLESEKRRTAASAQKLELSDELFEWITKFSRAEGSGAVTMLNLLAFKEGMKGEYLKYGQAFAKSVGARRGGAAAKIVGSVISPARYNSRQGESQKKDSELRWDELALAHYPTISHFADMIASEDYQEANHKYIIPSLKDTLIICTTDLDIPTNVDDSECQAGNMAKL